MLRRRTLRGPSTGYFQIPVCTVRPCQATSFGRPTFTDFRTATMPLPSPPGPPPAVVGSAELLSTVDVVRGAGQRCVGHQVRRQRGDVARLDDALDRQGRPEL